MEGLRLKRSTRDWTGESRKLINAKLPKGKRVTAEGEQKMSLLSARSNVVASNLSQASHMQRAFRYGGGNQTYKSSTRVVLCFYRQSHM